MQSEYPKKSESIKKKIMFGLNARQLIATLLALFVCVPLYYWGRNYLSDDILSWIIILIAVPLVAIGFFKFNGMPMEKFVVAFMKFELLFPLKRKYKTDNAFRDWQNEAIKEENRSRERNAERRQNGITGKSCKLCRRYTYTYN